MVERLMIVSASDPVAADYANHVHRAGWKEAALVSETSVCRKAAKGVQRQSTEDLLRTSPATDGFSTAVVFIGRRWGIFEQALLEAVCALTRAGRRPSVCIVGTFRVHFGDHRAIRLERDVVSRFEAAGAEVTVLRRGHVLSDHSLAASVIRATGSLAPLAPPRLATCFLDANELFDALDRETRGNRSRFLRTVTLLGPNRPWRELLRERRTPGIITATLSALAMVLSLFGVGWILACLFRAIKPLSARLQYLDFDTLRPTTPKDLLALYSRHNYKHVKIVGYNNGVVHFGQRYPGRTIVSTVRCNQVVRIGDGVAKFDGGVTIQRAVAGLAETGQEFYVLPNYSYVSLGTAFFVPIHGSASAAASTLGDTIEKVVLYDPADDRMIVARKHDPDFDRYIFGLDRHVLLLRLYVRLQRKSLYFVQRQVVQSATGSELLGVLADDQPSNVEIRKAKAAGQTVNIFRYYAGSAAGGPDALEFPRDAVGRLWDRIERNPVSAALFHGLMRRFGYHVELFLPHDEFVTFWSTHGHLPISKIQLRYVRRDGRPHSPFRDHDCVSADLFMLRRHKQQFDSYVKTTLGTARYNPGKHSA
jgi:hypothetical protein